MSFAEQVIGKKVLVFGLGSQGGGVGDALWLHANRAIVRVTDLRSAESLSDSLTQLPSDITSTLTQHLDEDIDWADIIIKNPGVPDQQLQIQYAAKQGKSVHTSIALVVQEARDKTIGITGTRGKTTTTELIYASLNAQYPDQIIKGGNLAGTSGLALLDQISSAKYLILELSSFQLAGLHTLKISPKYAVLTNIYPDHLNRYKSMKEYQQDKSAIFLYQDPSDHLFVNQDNSVALGMADGSASQVTPFSSSIVSDWHLTIPGDHNLENAAATYELAKILGLDHNLTRSTVESFAGVPYRLELIREVNGVSYYNDTTSTTPTATIKALGAFTSPITLILGGDQKDLPTDGLINSLKTTPNLKNIIILGSANIPDFITSLRGACPDLISSQVNSMQDAVTQAVLTSKSGDVILLSPGFASFDLFENEFDRGRQFNLAVNQLSSTAKNQELRTNS